MMEEFRRRLIGMTPESGLPKGYFRCEYIESDGTNYIDTGFKPNQDTKVILDIDCPIDTGNRSRYIFGTDAGSSSKGAFSLSTYLGKYQSYYNTSGALSFENNGANQMLIVKDKQHTYCNDTLVASATYASFQSDYSAYIFCSNSAGSSYNATSLKLYSCQIYDNGVKIRDYVPCVSPDGYFGLYDLVTDEFYGFVQQKTARSYTVSPAIHGNWVEGGFTNPDSSKYDAYMSYTSRFVDSGYDIMRITITGYDEFICYIRSCAESSYDYTVIGDLDTELTYSMSGGSVGVKAHTQGNQQGTTDIESYTKVVYTGIGGGTHFIDVMYRKDGSVNSADDRGYLLIDKSTVSSGGTIQVIGRGKVILPSGYINAEYIEGDGNAWVDSGYFPNGNTKVVMDAQMNSYSSGLPAFFGAFGTSNKNSFAFLDPARGSNYYAYYYGSSNTTNNKITAGMFDRGIIITDKGTANYHGTIVSLADASFTSTNTLYLFCGNENGTLKYNASMRLYQCQIHDNGTFTKFFVPCSKDGVFGLYEMFEGIFYSSEGSSEFTGESDGDNEGLSEGVFIEDTTGKLWDIDKWDGSATFNSVAVIGDTHSFGISGSHIGACDFSPWTFSDDGVFYGVDYGLPGYDSVELAYEDMDGEGNTNIIISSQGTGNTYAAQKCRSHNFPNGKSGYLMAAGEYKMICDNITEINKALEKVGGKKVDINVSSSSIVGMWTSTYCPRTPYVAAENTYMGYVIYFYQERSTYAEGIQLVSFVHPTVDGPYNGVWDSFNGKFTASMSGDLNGSSRVSSNIGCRPLCSLKK